MNTLVAVAIAPFGVGDELAPYVAEAIRVIRDSGCPTALPLCSPRSRANGTRSWPSCATPPCASPDQGIRTEVILKADIRPEHSDTLHTKVEKVEALLTD